MSFAGFFILLGIIFFGTILYLFEQGEFQVTNEYPQGAYMRPNQYGGGIKPTPYTSIPTSMYWAVVTSVTVGYGDLYPNSIGGRVFAVICMYFGVILMALPITVIGSNFNREYATLNGNDYNELIFQSLFELVSLTEDQALARLTHADDFDIDTSIHAKVLMLTCVLDEPHRDNLVAKLKNMKKIPKSPNTSDRLKTYKLESMMAELTSLINVLDKNDDIIKRKTHKKPIVKITSLRKAHNNNLKNNGIEFKSP